MQCQKMFAKLKPFEVLHRFQIQIFIIIQLRFVSALKWKLGGSLRNRAKSFKQQSKAQHNIIDQFRLD